jgi:hypothetical protein
MVYPLVTITAVGDSFRSEACDGDERGCTRWLGAASYVTRPNILTPDADVNNVGVQSDTTMSQLLSGDEWEAIGVYAEWSERAKSAQVPHS